MVLINSMMKLYKNGQPSSMMFLKKLTYYYLYRYGFLQGDVVAAQRNHPFGQVHLVRYSSILELVEETRNLLLKDPAKYLRVAVKTGQSCLERLYLFCRAP